MEGESTPDFPLALGRVGAIQFSDTIDTSFGMKSRTRTQFEDDVNKLIVYNNGGTTDLKG